MPAGGGTAGCARDFTIAHDPFGNSLSDAFAIFLIPQELRFEGVAHESAFHEDRGTARMVNDVKVIGMYAAVARIGFA